MYMHYGRVGAIPTQRVYRLSDVHLHVVGLKNTPCGEPACGEESLFLTLGGSKVIQVSAN